MLEILRQIARIGIRTEPVPGPGDERVLVERLQQAVLSTLGRALAIRHVDAGSCNGCELEIHALQNPMYNIEGLGIRFVASPRHADMLLVTGPVSRHMAVALQRTYDATPDPKLVVAVGECGCTGGIFGESYASLGRVGNVIPVDVEIPGCPPSPAALLAGILAALRAARSDLSEADASEPTNAHVPYLTGAPGTGSAAAGVNANPVTVEGGNTAASATHVEAGGELRREPAAASTSPTKAAPDGSTGAAVDVAGGRGQRVQKPAGHIVDAPFARVQGRTADLPFERDANAPRPHKPGGQDSPDRRQDRTQDDDETS
jgi:Ni,Fe-hydrogenase III small subunit